MMTTRCNCSIIIPTHNRCAELADTLRRISALPDRFFETIVVCNGSSDRTPELADRHPEVRWIHLDRNLGAAARNVGAVAARGRVLLMLDDDSWPEPGTIDGLVRLFDRNPRLGAAACRVVLAEGEHADTWKRARHDAGGVPGVIFNCGGGVRRSAFLESGGYPIDYEYYVEEYDLCCRLWQRGWTVEPRGDLVVWHRRTTRNRDANRMLRLLVRNNLRLWRRYGPDALRDDLIESTIERYRRVALKENALCGYQIGLAEGGAVSAAGRKRRRPLTIRQFEDLFGLNRVRIPLRAWARRHRVATAVIWSRGKGCEQLIGLLRQIGVEIAAVYDATRARIDADVWRGVPLRDISTFDPRVADAIVVGSLSPGVAEDLRAELAERFPYTPVVSAAPWLVGRRRPAAVPT